MDDQGLEYGINVPLKSLLRSRMHKIDSLEEQMLALNLKGRRLTIDNIDPYYLKYGRLRDAI